MSLTEKEKKNLGSLFGKIDSVVNGNFKVIVKEICGIRKDMEKFRQSILTLTKVGKFTLDQLPKSKPKKKK